MSNLEGLWRENAEAWQMHSHLCGRTVRDYQLGSWVLQRLTDGWDPERITGLIDRLNLIASVLEPHGHAQN